MSEPKSDLPGDGLSGPSVPKAILKRLISQTQDDFEQDFYEQILRRRPEYVDVLRLLGNLYTEKGLYTHGLKVDKRLARLRPDDATVHYNLACSYSLLHLTERAVRALRRAFGLGYADFAYMKRDSDLDPIRNDPRYRQLLAEFGVP